MPPRAGDEPRAMFPSRKELLVKKAQELATLCGVDVAVLCAGYGDQLVWPSSQAVMATVRRYNSLPPEARARNLEDSADVLARRLEKELDTLARARDAAAAAAFCRSWDASLGVMADERLRKLLASIDGSLAAAAQSRTLVRQPQGGGAPHRDSIIPPSPVHAGEVTAEASVSVRARGASNAAQLRRQGKAADAGGDVSAPPHLQENPRAPNAAALVVASPHTAESSVLAPARDAGSGVRRRLFEGDDALKLPLEANPATPSAAPPSVAHEAAAGGNESEDVQILPPPSDADDNDALWMRDLVEYLKEKPPSSSAAAPNWSDETEYVYIGGEAIERDAYDYIRFDLGIPPPHIGPDSYDSDDGEPIKLWSWQ